MMSHSLNHSKIIHLSFNNMGWNELPPRMFVGLISTNVTKIQLTHNFIRHIKEDTFRPLKSLQELDLSWNGITDIGINFTGMSQLKNLRLAGNWFFYFPNFVIKITKVLFQIWLNLIWRIPKYYRFINPLLALITWRI